jgi:integrase
MGPRPQVLTDKAIKAMKLGEDGAYRVPDLRCKGLALRVAPNGGKTWDLGFRIKGAGVRRLSLGRYEDVGLEAARQRANEITLAARQGVDLVAEEAAGRDRHEQSFTVERLIDEYVRRRVAGRLRTAGEIERRLKRSLAGVLTRKATDIRRRDLRELLDAVSDSGLAREAGHRRTAIGTMFKWAFSQDIVETDPAHGLGSYGLGQPRDRVLSEVEIRLLWRWLDNSRSISAAVADILKLQLCLGARVGEVAGMRASELATDDKRRLLWTLPEERSKTKSARTTPILGLAAGIVRARVEANEDVLFESESGKPHTSGSVGGQLRERASRMPIDWFRSHDLRRTAATMMVKAGMGLELVATIVGHTAGGAQTSTLVRHYVHDEFLDRKALGLAQWDRRLRSILAGESGKVVELRTK